MNEKSLSLDLLKSSLVSLNCWNVIGGQGGGTAIALSFGNKIPRLKELGNSTLTEEERQYEGEYSLFIECAWRLQTQNEVLCTSLSGNSDGQVRNSELRQLIGKHVLNVEIRLPGGDLEIVFHGGRTLMVFADQANEVDRWDNYTFRSPAVIIKNGYKSQFSFLSR